MAIRDSEIITSLCTFMERIRDHFGVSMVEKGA